MEGSSPVSKVGLGTNAVGGQRYYPNITDEDGRKVLYAALEYGIDFWDTAFTYGPKRSEEIIGEPVLHPKYGTVTITGQYEAGVEYCTEYTIIAKEVENPKYGKQYQLIQYGEQYKI